MGKCSSGIKDLHHSSTGWLLWIQYVENDLKSTRINSKMVVFRKTRFHHNHKSEPSSTFSSQDQSQVNMAIGKNKRLTKGKKGGKKKA